MSTSSKGMGVVDIVHEIDNKEKRLKELEYINDKFGYFNIFTQRRLGYRWLREEYFTREEKDFFRLFLKSYIKKLEGEIRLLKQELAPKKDTSLNKLGDK
jgi:hypothetical protein